MQSPSLRELFDTVVELPSSARAAFLAERCSDAQLRSAVERLLQADARDNALFSGGAAAVAQAIGDVDLTQNFAAGTRLGPFELIAFLGEGGSSTVFHARREVEGVRQDVALKILRRGLYSPEAQRQFRRERQALTQLKHPGIACLIEGGVSPGGTAYIALDLIEGKPITDYVHELKLDLRRRLQLFVQVCRAVDAAHRALIVHRDLKPSNVLVTDDGCVKLLDFGIAKLLDADEETQTKLPAFTPAYAAPEQHTGAAITTATDVYSLGVLLGELVTGQRMTDGSGRTPSSQISDQHSAGLLPATAPITRRALRGDLDNIVLKAIAAEPERRYSSAGTLADDIERMLDGLPVAAHPPSAWYRTQKFISRHRSGVVVSLGFFLAVMAALGIALWQASVARLEAQAAAREAARATATKDFVVRIFRASDPRFAQDKPREQITAKDLLDVNAAKIGGQFAGDPATQIELLGVVASAYRELGDKERYDALHQQQIDLARRTDGELSPVLIEGLIDQAQLANRRRDFSATHELLGKADPLIRRADLERSWLRGYWWLSRGVSLQGNFAARAERTAALQNAVSLYAQFGPTHSGYAEALYTLGVDSVYTDPAAAEQYDRKAIAIMEGLPDRDDSGLQVMYGGLAVIQQNRADFDGAERTYAHVAELARSTTGVGHPRYWAEEAKHARMVHRQGDRVRALQMFDALLGLLPVQADAEQIDTVASVRELHAECLLAEGLAKAAITPLEAVKQRREQVRGAEANLRNVRTTLGDAYDRVGRAGDARRELQASLQEWIEKSPADAFFVLQIRERWGRFLLNQNDAAGAEAQFREVLAQAHDRNFAPVALAQSGIARLALGRHDAAAAVAESRRAIETFDHVIGVRDVRVGPDLWLILADALRASGDSQGAEQWARRALEASRRYDDPSAPSIRNAEAALQAVSANP